MQYDLYVQSSRHALAERCHKLDASKELKKSFGKFASKPCIQAVWDEDPIYVVELGGQS
jgi:hypothetical protein